jgi:hypothetical protein
MESLLEPIRWCNSGSVQSLLQHTENGYLAPFGRLIPSAKTNVAEGRYDFSYIRPLIFDIQPRIVGNYPKEVTGTDLVPRLDVSIWDYQRLCKD